MAHLRITQREARQGFKKLYYVGNYPLIADEMNKVVHTFFYNNTNVYGWTCNVYPLSYDVALSIGYRSFGIKNKEVEYIVKDFNSELENIRVKSNMDYIYKEKAREKATANFIARILEVANGWFLRN